MRRAHGMFALLLAVCVTAALDGCGSTDAVLPSSRLPVVRAYLYANEPVSDIRLTWTLTLDAADTIPAPINDATVTLTRGGVRYALVKASGDSGYYRYAGSDLVVRVGDIFDFEAKVAGQMITARTQVPNKPVGAKVAADTLKVPTFAGFVPGQRPDFGTFTDKVSWQPQAGALFYVTVESVDASPVPIDNSLPRFGPRRIVFSPTAADTFTINALSLAYYGAHRVRVYRVNEEYAQLYASRQQDSRDLNEPATNVRGGLGVFSAFASDTARFIAVKQ